MADQPGPIDSKQPGLLSRIVRAVAREVTGGNEWLGPGQPIAPVAPADVRPRRFDYPISVNVTYTPRAYEGVSFAALRRLADMWDLLRLVIETRKDQMVRIPWSFRLVAGNGEPPRMRKEREVSDGRLRALHDFFKKPDGENPFDAWLRMILEDVFVTDAVSILPRWRRDGGIWGFDVIDGTTIRRIIDAGGRTPQPPEPAYQQILHGVPARDLISFAPDRPFTDQLMYVRRNPRSHKLYGYPPVEQIIMTVNIALRRQLYQLEWFTEGNIPEAFASVPDTWTPGQIAEFEAFWNAKFGTTAARRQLHFVPDGQKVSFSQVNELHDEMDEWLARIVAFAFSIPPTALVKMVNRASGQQMSEDAKAEGLDPLKNFITTSIMNPLVQDALGYKDIEFAYGDSTRTDPVKKAQTDAIYIGVGVKSVTTVQEELGLDPEQERENRMTEAEAGAARQALTMLEDSNSEGSDSNRREPGQFSKENKDKDKGVKLLGGKKKSHTVLASETTPSMERGLIRLTALLSHWLDEQGRHAAGRIVEHYRERIGEKAVGDDDLEKIIAELIESWKKMIPKVTGDISATFRNAGEDSPFALQATLFDQLDTQAQSYAQERAAELVGMRIVRGRLVANPDARLAITDTTRDELRRIVANAFAIGQAPKDLQAAIEESFAFSARRAEMIARTELAKANIQGHLAAAELSGVVAKEWILGSEHEAEGFDDECDENADQGPVALGELFASGDDGPPAHPNCVCGLIFYTASDVEGQEFIDEEAAQI